MDPLAHAVSYQRDDQQYPSVGDDAETPPGEDVARIVDTEDEA